VKSLVTLFCLCIVSVSASAAPRAVIALHPSPIVTGDTFDLADIATVTSSDTVFRLQLMNAQMGRSPLAGLSRPFDHGQVDLKLRQAGIDPETVSITGADSLTISAPDSAQSTTPPQPLGRNALPSQSTDAVVSNGPKTVLIHSGDRVTLVYDADGMTITADVTATTSGTEGDTINLRRDGAICILSGVVQDAHTVRMME
jgi:hypothetical protein